MTDSIDDFFDEYLLTVVGGCVVLLSLFTTCLAVLVLGVLRIKFKQLQKRVRHYRTTTKGDTNLVSIDRLEG